MNEYLGNNRFRDYFILCCVMIELNKLKINSQLGKHFARPLNLAAMFFCAPAQKHKIGNTSSQKWVLRSIELTQQQETFCIYELNSYQRHFSLNTDEFQSSHTN